MSCVDLFVNRLVLRKNKVWSYRPCHRVGSLIFNGIFVSNMSRYLLQNPFEWKLDEELYRLNKMTPPSTDSYDPLLPVLWMTM